jgi:hypothetical protein
MAGMKSPSRDGEGKEKTTTIYPDHSGVMRINALLA